MANFLDAINSAIKTVANVASGQPVPTRSSQSPNAIFDAVNNAVNTVVGVASNANNAPQQVQQPTYQNSIPNLGSFFSAPAAPVSPNQDVGKMSQSVVQALSAPASSAVAAIPEGVNLGMADYPDQSVVVDGVEEQSEDQPTQDEQEEQQAEQQQLNPWFELKNSLQSLPDRLASYDLSDYEKAFQDDQARRLEQAKQLTENQLYAAYTMNGANPSFDPYFQQNIEAIRNMKGIPFTIADQQRRFTDKDGNFEFNPLNLLGFTSQDLTSDAGRNLYDYHFNQEDKALREGDMSKRIEAAQRRRRAVDKNVGKSFWDEEILDPYAIDDGVDPRSREALFMTGEQYIKYRNEFGIPGRDVRKIDPDELYNKQDEMDNYGFVPYLTSEESMYKFHDDETPHAISNLFNHIADFRRENTDFTVNFDGKNISGKNLIQNGNLWWKRNAGKINDAEIINDPNEIDENSVPYTYVLTDSSGNQVIAKSPLVETGYTETGQPYMAFEDGDVWTFDDEADVQRSLSDMVTPEGGQAHYWRNIEPLVLDDGTTLRADRAQELLAENNYEKFADYGGFNMSKPAVDDPFKDSSGNFNLNPAENDFLPWITDTALGSLPYFFIPTAATQGIGNAMANYAGFQPGYQDYINGTYSLLSDNPTRADQMASTLGSLALPVTEHLWGNIGSRFLEKPLMKAIGKNIEDIRPLARYGMGALGEGLEEIPGNIVEEFQNNGIRDWYADDMYRDENGNLTTEARYDDKGNIINRAYDNQGNVIKNPDTDMSSRFRNFVGDIPLAFIGGATLGGTLGVPAIGGYYSEYMPRKMERDEFGNNQEIVVDPSLVVDLTDEERDYYNR